MVFYSDIDDTLMLRGKVSNKVDQFLKTKDENIIFVPCSGRPTSNLINTFSKYSVKYIIGFNGGEIYDLEENKIIYENGLNKEEVKEVVINLENLGIDYVLYDDKQLYTNNLENKYAQEESELTLLEISKMEEYIPSAKILGLYNPSEIDGYIKKLRALFPNLEIAKSKPYFIEITKKGSTKGNTIDKLNELLNISTSDTYVFGDSDNDISMFETDAKKIAVKNANDNILSRADEVCDSCENDGVIKYIEKIINK